MNEYKMLTPRFYVIAGEASGDRYGAELCRTLQDKFPEGTIWGLGGEMMKAAGQRQLLDLAKHAVVGLTDVLLNYFKFYSFFNQTLEDIKKVKPDLLILIDYPGFNLRLAERVKKMFPDIKIVYYISPQVWAWKRNRIKTMKRIIDLLFVIFPFEKDWFNENAPEMNVVWPGHPLMDRLILDNLKLKQDKSNTVALLPGSRKKEISKHLPVLITTAHRLSMKHPNLKFIILTQDETHRQEMIKRLEIMKKENLPIQVIAGNQVTHLSRCALAIVASGTATVECCVAGVPMMVVYSTSKLTFLIGKMLVKLPYLSMVNILAGENIVPEFLQEKASPEYLVPAVEKMLLDEEFSIQMRNRLQEVRDTLGHEGCNKRIVEEIEQLLLNSERGSACAVTA
jgi:lipid-A-disaccharide synthase